MKVYIVLQYIDEETQEPVKVFDNAEAANSFVSNFDGDMSIFEMDTESVNICTPQYIVRTITHWNFSKVYCTLPRATWHIAQAIKDPYFCVVQEDWNPRQKVLLELGFAVNSEEAGINFANLANDTVATANKMFETHSFEEVKQFITSTLKPIMEEIRIKEGN